MRTPSKPLRILIGAETYPPDVNGAANFTERLATGLARRGHDVHVVAPSPVGEPITTRRAGVTVHGIRSHRYPFHPDFQVCMPWEAFGDTAREMSALHPDVVHTQGHMVVGRGVIAAARRAGRPLVATNHLMPENLASHAPLPRSLTGLGSRIAWWDLGRVFGKADVVTAPTPRAVELLVTRAGLADAVPVSCGIDADRYHNEPARPGDVLSVLFVGRLDQEKRVEDLLRAFAGLPNRLPARLDIVGDGACRPSWEALARTLGIAGRTTFHGFLSEADLLTAYAQAAVFVMPSIAELQSLATLEAMAAHTPVVAADAMALPHLVDPGRNGWLYPPADVPALTSRLATLLSDDDLRRRMGARSRALVDQHAIDATLDTFEGIYWRCAQGAHMIDRAAA